MVDQYTLKDPSELYLDLENPRFGLSDAVDQVDALRILRTRANLKELLDSISEKGFQRFEPLVAIDRKEGGFIVIEGNRRLSAVKLLLNPELASEVGVRSLPVLTDQVRDTIVQLPVIVVGERSEAAEYIGFKHINGPTTWGSLAKAKFANKLYQDTLAAEGRDVSVLELLSKRLGDGRQLLLRIIIGFRVFQQAWSNGFIDENRLDEGAIDFSHIYTMLQNPSTRDYLGLGTEPLSEAQIIDNPIPINYLPKLNYFIGWLFGNENVRPVIKQQGTDRPKLTKILASTAATEVLEASGDFERALSLSDFKSDLWLSNVTRLEVLASNVLGSLTSLPPELDDSDVGKSIDKLKSTQRHVQGSILLFSSFYNK